MRRKSEKITALVLVVTVTLMVSFTPVFAHSGRIDANGGHRDNKNKSGLGAYHYHHGNGPHLHKNYISLHCQVR